jgi:hypothetical protein
LKSSLVKSFVIAPQFFMLHRKRNSPNCAARIQTKEGSTALECPASTRTPTALRRRAAGSGKERVRCRRLPLAALNQTGFRLMPRYFFNTRIGEELIADPEGEELRNPDRAWEIARAMIRELLKTEGTDGSLLNAILEVTDDDGEIVLEFPFAEAILDLPDEPVTKH